MPGKDRRVASRQAELRRRKRQDRGPSGIPSATPLVADAPPPTASDTAVKTSKPASPAPAVTSSTPPPARTASSRRPTSAARSTPQVNVALVARELRRISILTGVMLAILIALAVALG